MKILITGSRSIDKSKVNDVLRDEVDMYKDEIITGGASGVDEGAIEFAKALGIKHITIRPIDTAKISYLYRNAEMIGMCDRVIAIWDGKSKGTKFTIDYAKKRGKTVKVITT